ncbi:serine hydrolase domain-containing protein [Aquirufa sp. 2-AUSEE-184A6]|uniref:Serine hydrolase domain-containing protein n=1 Tax=Aquirufa novilacunae TaxID=3139305 RepID=A0ABW8SXM3_9BACT
MKKLFLLLFCAINVFAQSGLPTGDPIQAGLSKEGIQRVDAFLTSQTDKKIIPGSIGMIVRHGKVVYKKAFGKANLETGEAMRTDHLFRMASMSKIITAVAGLKLYERGLFTMDTPLGDILPEFANMQVLIGYDTVKHEFITRPAKNKILMKHVFTHTSGIAYPPFASLGHEAYVRANITFAFPKVKSGLKLAEIIQSAAKLPLTHEPGESWTYGMNLEVLGRVIEKLDGRSFPDFLRQEIFAPLKMNRTYLGVPTEEWKNVTQVYTRKSNGQLGIYTDQVGRDLMGFSTETSMDFWKDTNTQLAMGGTDVMSNVDDYARFFQMLLNYGELDGARILSKKTVEMIEKPLFDVATKDGVAMGVTGRSQFKAGITVYVYPEEQAKFETISAGSYFWLGYFGTQFWIDRKEDMFSMVFMQLAPEPTGHNGKYRHLVWGSIAK